MNFTEEMVKAAAIEAYSFGEVDWKIFTEKCALLGIDMQDEFVKPNWTPF